MFNLLIINISQNKLRLFSENDKKNDFKKNTVIDQTQWYKR